MTTKEKEELKENLFHKGRLSQFPSALE